MRVRLKDISSSRIPKVLGLCADDLPRISNYLNEAQQRLIIAMGETGAWGTWQKVVFNVSKTDPYITLPAEFARMQAMDVCRRPTAIQNEWYEFLEAGIGLQVPCPNGNPFEGWWCGTMQGFDRNVVPTAFNLTTTNQYLRVYLTDARDIGVKFQVSGALDQNGVGIYTQDVQNPVNGFIMLLDQPFTTSPSIVTSFNAIYKPVTYGDVLLKQVDATTGDEVLLSRYKPYETSPAYRRYFIKSLPNSCCPSPTPGFVQVTAMCKLEFQPAINPTDFLIIGNIPALKEECESIRYSEMDNPTAQQLSVLKHANAIKLLNEELGHQLGKYEPAVNVAPWGTAKLSHQEIGYLV